MHYIIFDLEFNQDFSVPLSSLGENYTKYPFEIIQIGAIKLDFYFNTVDTFTRFIRPTIYKEISPFITDLTGITIEQLINEESFSEVFHAFTQFIGGKDSILTIWGMSDVKELYKSAENYKLDKGGLPDIFIDIQPYVPIYLGMTDNKLLSLQAAVDFLGIPISYRFHNALNDAYYTAEIFKKVNGAGIQPKKYDPKYVKIRPRKEKKVVDYEGLLLQFEKMYGRELSEEEVDMITLAYKMGKTNQFLKVTQ